MANLPNPESPPTGAVGERPVCLDVFQAMPWPGLCERLRTGSHRIDPRVMSLDEGLLDRSFGAGEGVGRWSCRQLLGHCADAELVLIHRMRRGVAEDGPMLAIWDEDAFLDSGIYDGPGNPAAAFVATIHTLRLWTGRWLVALSPDQLERRVLHPERGELTVRSIVEYAAWHLEHHGWFLRAKLDLLVGAASPAEAAGEGCGPGCACAG